VRRGDTGGFALVAVLWILVAASAAAVQFHRTARASRLASINAGAEVKARWAAREGLARAVDAIERFGMASGDWERAGLGRAVRLAALPGAGPAQVDVRILDARSRLDLNHATPEELERLLHATLGPSDPRIPMLRDGMLEARTAGFGAVRELSEVKGSDRQVYAALKPLVTVNGDGTVNVNTASPPVLAAVLGIAPSLARLVAERARVRPFANVFEVVRVLPPYAARPLEVRMTDLRTKLAFAPQDVEVHVEASIPRTGVVARIEASVGLVRGDVWELRKIVES
jgi:type II secretory pathway component PulK